MRLISTGKINHCMVARLLQGEGENYMLWVAARCPITQDEHVIKDLCKNFPNQGEAKTYLRQLRRDWKNSRG